MLRREFVAGLGAMTALPLQSSIAQQRPPVVGWLGATVPGGFYEKMAAAFIKGLGEMGYVDGRNVAIDYRWAAGRYDRLPELVSDLIGRRVSVIAVSGGTAPILAAKAATTTIPIVFVAGADPVKSGVVESLSRPGANVTGVSNLVGEVEPKKLELLHRLVPDAKVIAVFLNPANPTAEPQTQDLRDAARKLGLQLQLWETSTEAEIESNISKAVHGDAGAAFFVNDGFLISHYVARILKGEKPADLPIFRSTKLELVFNLKTAKALGLTIPETLLATADEVIQ
jgi:putative tryptophan/tyrosine transport system substrate-binding protein